MDCAARTRVAPSCELRIAFSVARRYLPLYNVGAVVSCMSIHARTLLLGPVSTHREAMFLIRLGRVGVDACGGFAERHGTGSCA